MNFRNILGKKERVNIESIQSDFVSLASHQLRTPLSAIKWFTEILLDHKGSKIDDKQRGYLSQIYKANERAINLVNDLLDVSRIQEGQIHLELRPTKIEEVIEEIIDYFADVSSEKKVLINFEIVNGPIPSAEVDREKIKRVIMNLLSNSIKYTPSSGKVRITLEKDHYYLKVTVSDTGVGIPRGEQKKVFAKFFRAANVIKVAPDGTGLGLFIAKSLIEAMGGTMGFFSEEGRGATFYFTIPVKLAKP